MAQRKVAIATSHSSDSDIAVPVLEFHSAATDANTGGVGALVLPTNPESIPIVLDVPWHT